MEEHPHTTCLNAAVDAADRLAGVLGFVVRSWSALVRGVRPPPRGPEDFERTGFSSDAALPTSLGQ